MFKKKSLGQHFLHSPHYLKLIVDAAHIVGGEEVLEIGPGDGALTEELLSRGARVIAIEKDHRLISVLQEKLTQEVKDRTFSLHEGDALRLDISSHVHGTYKLVANIPYYITGAIIKKFLSGTLQPSAMVLLVQKEVAERVAREKKESILSLSVKAYGTPHYVKTVPRGAFVPAPSVDSAILSIESISRKNFNNKEHEERFFKIVKAGFAHKRKLLSKNLAKIFGKEHSNILQNVGIPEKARAEDVALLQWLALSRVEELTPGEF